MNAKKTGNLISEIRNRKNLTQKELAEKINVSDKAVSKWERGEGCPDVSILPSLAKALGIEIESLMDGALPVTQDISGKKIKEYNFRQPDRYPKEMQQDLAMLGAKLCQEMVSQFSSLLNIRFECGVHCVDQMTNFEFLRSLPEKCFFYDFNYNEAGFCIAVDSEIGKAMIKQDFMKHESVDAFDLDVFKNYLLKIIVLKLKEIICKRTDNKIEQERFSLEKVCQYGNPNNAMQEQNYMMLLLCIECNIGETKGYMNFQFSAQILEDMLRNNFFNRSAANRIKFQKLSNIKEKEIPDNIFVEFGRYNTENVELEYGKILILDKKEFEPLNVVYENKVIHTGKTVAIDENFGIKIEESAQLNEIVYDEDDYISIQLGSACLTKEEISGLHKDSYLILKQRAGEFTKIIRSGKILALGEICIADDKFAIRITEVK